MAAREDDSAMKGFRAVGCLRCPVLPGPGGFAELAQPGTKQGFPRTRALQGVEPTLSAARPSPLPPTTPLTCRRC